MLAVSHNRSIADCDISSAIKRDSAAMPRVCRGRARPRRRVGIRSQSESIQYHRAKHRWRTPSCSKTFVRITTRGCKFLIRGVAAIRLAILPMDCEPRAAKRCLARGRGGASKLRRKARLLLPTKPSQGRRDQTAPWLVLSTRPWLAGNSVPFRKAGLNPKHAHCLFGPHPYSP